MIKSKTFLLLITATIMMLLCACSRPTQVAGGVTGAGNALVVGKIAREDGAPAPNTQVMLLKESYNPAIQPTVPDSLVDTTDSNGAFSVLAGEGTYNVQAVHISTRTSALTRGIVVMPDSVNIDTVTVPVTTLHIPGTIYISLDNLMAVANGYLFIEGTSVKMQLDSAAIARNNITLDSVPSGNVPGVKYLGAVDTATIIPVTSGVTVPAGDTISIQKEKTTAIYYSVGVQTGALYTGTGSADTGILTLGSPAPANAGVGDEVRANAARYYITERYSSTSFAVQTPAGQQSVSFAATSVSIYRAFNSLEQAVDASTGMPCAADSNHLNSSDLITGNYLLNIACYGDGADNARVVIQGWNTSPVNYIKIYTPISASETGISQRHKGTWNTTGAYALHVTANDLYQAAIGCVAPHVKIDGLQIWIESAYAGGDGIKFFEQGYGEFDVSNSVIRATHNRPAGAGFGIYVYNNSGNGPVVRFWNNIIYNFADSANAGIQLHFSITSGVIANNTLVNCYFAVSGYLENVVLRNNLTSLCARSFFPWGSSYNPANDYNVSNSKEYNTAAIHSRDSVFAAFVDTANNNFHLAPGDTVARDRGMADPVPGLFSNDIDGEPRTAPWDVGADEVYP